MNKTDLESIEIGSDLLFRISTLPTSLFLNAGNPDLFAECARFDEFLLKLERDEKRISQKIILFVNSNDIPRSDTKILGKLAKRLARGTELCDDDRSIINSTLKKYNSRLADLATLVDQHRTHANQTNSTVAGKLDSETSRSAANLWRDCLRSSNAMTLLKHRDPAFFERGLEEGGDIRYWRGKKGRLRAQYLNRIVTRATFRNTPRDWHSTVGWLSVLKDCQTWEGWETDNFLTVWTENIHILRKTLALEWPGNRDFVNLTLTPFRWSSADKFSCCVTDWDNVAKVEEVELKRSNFLNAMLNPLMGQTRSYQQLCDDIQPLVSNEEMDILEDFLSHLIKLGVIQLSQPPQSKTVSWHPIDRFEKHKMTSDGQPKTSGYLDVYTRLEGNVAYSQIVELQQSFCTLARLSMLIEAEIQKPPTAFNIQESEKTDSECRLIDAVKSQLFNYREDAEQTNQQRNTEQDATITTAIAATRPQNEWPIPETPETPYGRLLCRIQNDLNSNRIIEINDHYLTSIGAASWSLRWPCDAFVRLAEPNKDYVAVFDEAFPAGSMDARFITPATIPAGHDGQYQTYKGFLQELTRQFDYRFVEILFPPLSSGAANAIRRPQYSNFWTGDSDVSTYIPDTAGQMQFIPLEELIIKQRGLTKRTFWSDAMIFPMYHATRLPIAPWNIVTESLLNASPFQMRWAPRRMHRLLDAFPNEEHAPPLMINGGLIVSCEQWRLPKQLEWQEQDSTLHKTRILSRLRKRLDLPRVFYLSPGPGRRPLLCDMENIDCLRVFKHAYQNSTDMLAIAMTPSGQSALIRKSRDTITDRMLSSTLLRLPVDETLEELCARVGPDLAKI